MKKSIFLIALISSILSLSTSLYAQTPNWQWAKSAGGTNDDYASSVAVDASGNIYMAGYFISPTITFGSYTLTSVGLFDIFLAKYDASGNVQWAKSTGGSGDDFATSVSVDASGNIYLTGYFNSPTITFGSDTLTNAGNTNLFLAKYDNSGTTLWVKSAGGTGNGEGYYVAVDAVGNAYVTGIFDSPIITFGSYSLPNAGYGDIFLVKYDANGNVLWAKSAGGASEDVGNSVAVDALGNSYMTGEFGSPTITFGSYTLTNAGSNDLFLVKYDTYGNVLWAKSAGGTSYDIGNSVAVDALDNSYVTGRFASSTITFGTYTLTNSNDYYDIFLVKYDSGGNVLWAQSAGGTSYDIGNSVAVDVLGNSYLTGEFASPTITFGSDTLINTRPEFPNLNADIFLVKYDSNGNVLWAKSAGGAGDDVGNSVALDSSGNAFVTGYFNSPSITFGSDTLTNIGGRDIFLAKSGSIAGINKLSSSLTILVFPNPATDEITIKSSGISKETKLAIVNIEGQQLITRQITEPKTNIDISNLPNGIYFVRLTGERTVEVGKIIKQ